MCGILFSDKSLEIFDCFSQAFVELYAGLPAAKFLMCKCYVRFTLAWVILWQWLKDYL